ncbi:MAG TPA: geranylgeranylglycerol-phosphate geranylgeranyltransferase [Ignavibacteriaceae bacterium]|nr:geranylgeranylglycerol-phosphate geranylgeranyltransferase [Ignavibacteriaceae bacterium]
MNFPGKFSAIVKLVRPLNFLIAFASIIVAALISVDNSFTSFSRITSIILLAGISGAFTASAGYIINDYFDISIDRINRPERPLASGSIKQKEAVILYFIFFLGGLILSFFINIFAFLIALIASNLLFLYSYKLKRIILVGNITTAFLTGLAFIYGGVAVNNLKSTLFPALFAFLINFSRELIKDIEDIEGDKREGILTFPGKYGILNSKLLINFTTGVLIISTFIPFILKIYNIEFTVIAAVIIDPVLVYFLISLNENHSLKNLQKLSNILKLDMAFGLAAIYLGK